MPAIDGLRGALALFVMIHHATLRLGAGVWTLPFAKSAVIVFFVLSGYVLARGWDGRYGTFLLRRFVRLWPTYALCLGVGYLIAGRTPVWSEFLWYPVKVPDQQSVNPPGWSLCVEAWAMLFFPAIVWIGSGSLRRWVLVLVAAALIVPWAPEFVLCAPFVVGAALTRWVFRCWLLETPVAQWLGRISYSLYLTQWLVFTLAWRFAGDWGGIAAVPAALCAAWLIWWAIERPSIWGSRRLSRWPGFLTWGSIASQLED